MENSKENNSIEEHLRRNRLLFVRFLAPSIWVLSPGVIVFCLFQQVFMTEPSWYFTLFSFWVASGVSLFLIYVPVLKIQDFLKLLAGGFLIQVVSVLFFYVFILQNSSSFQPFMIPQVVLFLIGPQLVVTGVLAVLMRVCRKSPRYFRALRIIILLIIFAGILAGFFGISL